MANKQLTVKVRLNTSQSEQKLRNIARAIDAINRTANKQGSTYQAVNNALSKVENTSKRVKQQTDNTTNGTKRWSNALSEVNKKLNGSSRSLGMIGGKLKSLASTYLGIMGMKAVIGTSDTMTSAENKLNYVNAQNTAGGKNADGSYTQKTFDATQQSLNQMYASSQKVRMAYTDMMSNVSKSMALAGDAFDNNTNKAIRFQEIMAEAYAIGGASAQEMSSSMYQMIQALGAGTLAGDELRSVREGAPLAYQAIEKFAQGVYNTEESLKDLASQGKITSDMVVAAVMNAGNEMDSAFAQTKIRFDQVWTQIKNAAQKAFSPISKMLSSELQKAVDNGLIEKVTGVFNAIAKGIMIAFAVIKNVISWIVDNWYWLQHVVVGVLIAIITFLLIKKAVAIACAIAEFIAWATANAELLLMLVIIGLVIAAVLGLLYVFYLWKSGAIDTCTAIYYALLIVAGVILIIGLLSGNIAMIVIGAILAVLAVIFMFFEETCYWVSFVAGWIVNIVFAIVNFILACLGTLGALFYNFIALIVNAIMSAAMFIGTIVQWIVAFIVNLVMACGQSIVAISHNVVAAIINVGMALWNSLSAIAQNIGIAFQNAWIWAKNTFWEFIADVLRGVSKLEPVINGIAKLIGKSGVDFGGLISAAESKKGGYKSFVSVGSAWSSGMNSVAYKDVGDAWSTGWNTMDFANMGDMVSAGWNTMEFESIPDTWNGLMSTLDYVDPNAWASTAGDWGADVEKTYKDKINNWGSKFQNTDEKGSLLNKLGDKLGLDFSQFGDGIVNPNDPAYDLSKLDDIGNGLGNGLGDGLGGSGGNGGLGDKVGKIADNTDSIADSLDLTEEDLEYLRKLAEMEWKKEYTTASINIDMSNYNTVNGESDLDGIVTKLSDKLYEEMNILANGVYA